MDMQKLHQERDAHIYLLGTEHACQGICWHVHAHRAFYSYNGDQSRNSLALGYLGDIVVSMLKAALCGQHSRAS